MRIEDRLARLGLVLPSELPAPAGAYEPVRLLAGAGSLAAQVPGPEHPRGRVGAELTVEAGCAAARSAALNAVARLRQALEDLDRLVGLLHVAGHVASADGFLDQPRVLDAASELLTGVLGARGRHTRTAFGPARLPLDVSIELEITFLYTERP